EAFGGIVTNLVMGIRGASALTLVMADLGPSGAPPAGAPHPDFASVAFRAVGATRGHARAAFAPVIQPFAFAAPPVAAAPRPTAGCARLRGRGAVRASRS